VEGIKRGSISGQMTPEDIKAVVSQIKEDLDEHLQAINENTSEVQSNFEYLQSLNRKIDKLSERIDTIQLFLKGLSKADEQVLKKDNFTVQPLDAAEQKVFLVMYTAADTPLTCQEVAQRVGFSNYLTRQYLTNLVEKGVPLEKQYYRNQACYIIKKSFRDVQAKENILKIDQQVLR